MPRLFLALVPSATELSPVADLPRDAEQGVRWVDPAQWHVTLRFLGECEVTEVAAALDGVTLPHVTPRLGPTVTLLGPRVLAVPVTGVDPLHHAVVAATRGVGRAPDDRAFRAHLTLARLDHGVRPTLLGHRVSGSFDGDEVTLVRSTLGADGATHESVHRWPTSR